MKSTINLPKDGNTASIQVFPLSQGKIDITTGVHTDVRIFRCIVAGDLTFTWPDETTTTVSFVAGDDYGVTYADSIEVDSGTFHLA